VVAIYGDPEPVVETYVSVTGAPDRIGAIAQIVQDDVGALRADVSEGEFDTAVAQVRLDIELFADPQLIDEILSAEVEGLVTLEDFADHGDTLRRLTIDDVRTFIADYLPADRYIEISVLPR
jgi:hypothetical protein